MLDIETENRMLSDRVTLSCDLVRHLFLCRCEAAVVITDKPVALMSASRKQWFKLIRQVQKERASTLDAKRILELDKTTSFLQNKTFTMKLPAGKFSDSIYFGTIEQLINNPPNCASLYIAQPIKVLELVFLTSRLPPGSHIVRYTMCKNK